MDIHQKKVAPDNHRLKTMVKRSIKQNLRISQKRKLWKERRSQQSGDNSVTKELKQIVGSGKPTGSLLKETIAVSVTISIACKIDSRILLRALLRGRMREMRREPEVPVARVPAEECFDCPARITSKELAKVHFLNNGTFQYACSTSPKVVADLERSAQMRIARLKNSLADRGSQKNGDKSAVGMLKRNAQHQRTRRAILDAYASNTRQLWLRISGYGADEVFIDFTEEHKHAETNPTCKIHESYCASRWHSRPTSIAWNDLPKWSPSALPQYLKIRGSVSRRDGMARAMCPWSSVEAG